MAYAYIINSPRYIRIDKIMWVGALTTEWRRARKTNQHNKAKKTS